MNKIVAGISLALTCNYCLAFDNNDAINLVKKFSNTIACAVNDESFKSVKANGENGTTEYDDTYIVYWEGDFGCSGGNGAVSPTFSLVKLANFNKPVVIPAVQQPNLDMVCVDTMTKYKDSIKISGITYSDSDSQHSPNQPVQYLLSVNDGKFEVMQKNANPSETIKNECVARVR